MAIPTPLIAGWCFPQTSATPQRATRLGRRDARVAQKGTDQQRPRQARQTVGPGSSDGSDGNQGTEGSVMTAWEWNMEVLNHGNFGSWTMDFVDVLMFWYGFAHQNWTSIELPIEQYGVFVKLMIEHRDLIARSKK